MKVATYLQVATMMVATYLKIIFEEQSCLKFSKHWKKIHAQWVTVKQNVENFIIDGSGVEEVQIKIGD